MPVSAPAQVTLLSASSPSVELADMSVTAGKPGLPMGSQMPSQMPSFQLKVQVHWAYYRWGGKVVPLHLLGFGSALCIQLWENVCGLSLLLPAKCSALGARKRGWLPGGDLEAASDRLSSLGV